MRRTALKRTGNGLRRKSKPVDPYDVWLHTYGSCIVTGQTEFQNAHTGDLRHGKGMSVKAWRGTILPLIAPLHWIEERERKTFWPTVGLPDYLTIAADLFKCFEQRGDPETILADAQSRVDRDYVRTLLGEIDY